MEKKSRASNGAIAKSPGKNYISHHHWGVYLHPSVFRYRTSGRHTYFSLLRNGCYESLLLNEQQRALEEHSNDFTEEEGEGMKRQEEIPAVVLLQGLIPRTAPEGRRYNHNYSTDSTASPYVNRMQEALDVMTSPTTAPKKRDFYFQHETPPPQLVCFEYEICPGRVPAYGEEERRYLERKSSTVSQMSSSRLNSFEEVLSHTSSNPFHPNNFFVPQAEEEKARLAEYLEGSTAQRDPSQVLRQAAAALQNHLYASRVNATTKLHFYEADRGDAKQGKVIRGTVRDQVLNSGEGVGLFPSSFLSGLHIALNSLAVDEKGYFSIAKDQSFAYTCPTMENSSSSAFNHSASSPATNMLNSAKLMDFQSIAQQILTCGAEGVVYVQLKVTKRVPLKNVIGPSSYLKEAVYYPILKHGTLPAPPSQPSDTNNKNLSTNTPSITLASSVEPAVTPENPSAVLISEKNHPHSHHLPHFGLHHHHPPPPQSEPASPQRSTYQDPNAGTSEDRRGSFTPVSSPNNIYSPMENPYYYFLGANTVHYPTIATFTAFPQTGVPSQKSFTLEKRIQALLTGDGVLSKKGKEFYFSALRALHVSVRVIVGSYASSPVHGVAPQSSPAQAGGQPTPAESYNAMLLNTSAFHDHTFDEALRHYVQHNQEYDAGVFFPGLPRTGVEGQSISYYAPQCSFISPHSDTATHEVLYRVLHRAYYYRLREPSLIQLEVGAYNAAHALSQRTLGSYTLLNNNLNHGSIIVGSLQIPMFVSLVLKSIDFEEIIKQRLHNHLIHPNDHTSHANPNNSSSATTPHPNSSKGNTATTAVTSPERPPLCIAHLYFLGENMNNSVLTCETATLGLLLYSIRKKVQCNLDFLSGLLRERWGTTSFKGTVGEGIDKDQHASQGTNPTVATENKTTAATSEPKKSKEETPASETEKKKTEEEEEKREEEKDLEKAKIAVSDLYFSPNRESLYYYYYSEDAAKCRRTETHLKLQVNDFDRRLFYNNTKLMNNVREQEERFMGAVSSGAVDSSSTTPTAGNPPAVYNPKNYPFFFSDPRSCLSTVRTFLSEICILLEFIQENKSVFSGEEKQTSTTTTATAKKEKNKKPIVTEFTEKFEHHFPNFTKRIAKGKDLREYVLLGVQSDARTSKSTNTSNNNNNNNNNNSNNNSNNTNTTGNSNDKTNSPKCKITFEDVVASVNQVFKCETVKDLRERILFNIISKCYNVLFLLLFNVKENDARPASYKHGYEYYFPNTNSGQHFPSVPLQTPTREFSAYPTFAGGSSGHPSNAASTSPTTNQSFASQANISVSVSASRGENRGASTNAPSPSPGHSPPVQPLEPSTAPRNNNTNNNNNTNAINCPSVSSAASIAPHVYSSEHYDDFKKFRYNYLFEVYHYISFCFYCLEGYNTLAEDYVHLALLYHPKEVSLYVLNILILLKQKDTLTRRDTPSADGKDNSSTDGTNTAAVREIEEYFEVVRLLLEEEKVFALHADHEVNPNNNNNNNNLLSPHMEVWEARSKAVESLRQYYHAVQEREESIFQQKKIIQDLLGEHKEFFRKTLTLS